MKFKRKPTFIKAEQWNGDLPFDGISKLPVDVEGKKMSIIGVVTPDGLVGIEPGDWVVKAPNGDKYKITTVDLRELYDPAEPVEED